MYNSLSVDGGLDPLDELFTANKLPSEHDRVIDGELELGTLIRWTIDNIINFASRLTTPIMLLLSKRWETITFQQFCSELSD